MNACLMLLLFFALFCNSYGASLKKEKVKKILPEETMGKILNLNQEKEIPFFEGDIILHKGKPDQKNAILDSSLKWTTDIPYVIHSEYSFEVRSAIEDALREFNVRLCVNFVPRQNEANYILFKKDSGCYSSVGMIGGEQVVSIGDGCESDGVIKHETMHALGFWHEQSRYDRDDFVEIKWENIQTGKEHNFNKYTEEQISTLGEIYDYASLMHYHDTAFSSNGQPTIVALQPGGSMMGQRTKFSDIDLNKLRKLYECDPIDGWTNWTGWSSCDLQCKKHKKRFCEGLNCTDVVETETANCDSTCQPNLDPDCPTPLLTTSYGSVTSSMFPFEYKVNVECSQTISVPEDETIRLEFEFMDIEHYQQVCYYDWLNVYDGPDENSPLLGKFCGTNLPPTIQSNGNKLTLTMTSDSSVSFRGYLANYYTNEPGSPLGTCHFEGDISACGWSHDSTGDFQWSRTAGSTSSSGTGPSYDHTSRQDQGNYMYIETSSPQTSGMLARLMSPLYPAPTTGHCLIFYYNMYGENIDTLSVMQRQEVSSNSFESLTIFAMLGNHGNDDWIQAKVNIYGQYPYKLVFQGKRGNGWMGDIAIDDVTVFPHSCEAL